jgi:hypothetical protein
MVWAGVGAWVLVWVMVWAGVGAWVMVGACWVWVWFWF